MTRSLRHIFYHPNIVANLRQSQPSLTHVSDDVLYWAYHLFSTSEDYADESKLPDWIESAENEMKEWIDFHVAKKGMTEDQVILVSHRRWEQKFYGEIRTHE